MSKNYNVYKDGDEWKSKREDASRAASSHATQADAQQATRGYISNAGGGEMTTHGVDGKIRAKDTIKPGNDPRSIPG